MSLSNYPPGCTDEDIDGGDKYHWQAWDEFGDLEDCAGELYEDLKRWLGKEQFELFAEDWIYKRAERLREGPEPEDD